MRSNCWRGCWPPGERPSANPALPSDPSVCRMVLFSAREVGGGGGWEEGAWQAPFHLRN